MLSKRFLSLQRATTYLTHTDGENKGLAAITAGVKLGAIGQGTCMINKVEVFH